MPGGARPYALLTSATALVNRLHANDQIGWDDFKNPWTSPEEPCKARRLEDDVDELACAVSRRARERAPPAELIDDID